jgi:hypothetical protein
MHRHQRCLRPGGQSQVQEVAAVCGFTIATETMNTLGAKTMLLQEPVQIIGTYKQRGITVTLTNFDPERTAEKHPNGRLNGIGTEAGKAGVITKLHWPEAIHRCFYESIDRRLCKAINGPE